MSQLLRDLRRKFEEAADPVKAPQMQAYMKSKMPYHGVPMPLQRRIAKETFRDVDLDARSAWEKAVLGLWRGAKFREERYAALDLCADKRARKHHVPASLKMYEEMVVDGAWWDFVDTMAHRVGNILREHPAVMKPKMLTWSRSSNIWKRRISILAQLQFKADTDLKLLYACIEPSLSSEEFFLRKAIGWALRQYAWVDAKEIRRYVRENEARLSTLSKREALKNVGASSSKSSV